MIIPGLRAVAYFEYASRWRDESAAPDDSRPSPVAGVSLQPIASKGQGIALSGGDRQVRKPSVAAEVRARDEIRPMAESRAAPL